MDKTFLPERPGTYASLPLPPAGPGLWAKILWYVATTIGPGIAWQAFDYGYEMATGGAGDATGAPDEWTRWRFVWEDKTSLDPADTQVFKLDVVNFTGGVIDSSWTDADLDIVADQFVSFATSLRDVVSSRLTCTKLEAYRMAFNPVDYEPKPGFFPPFIDSGSPVWSVPLTIAGGGTGNQASQVSSTITLQTPSRPNWGRMYVPTLSDASMGADGRVVTGQVDFLVNLLAANYEALAGNELYIVVPTTSVDKHRVRTLQNVTAVSADDIPDIQRRRRLHTTKHRHQMPALAATTDEAA